MGSTVFSSGILRMKLPPYRKLHKALILFMLILPILPARSEAEALMEDPFGIIGVAPTAAAAKP